MANKAELIEQLLSWNVEDSIQKDSLIKALDSGKKLRVKLGIDPTSPDLHLGHSIVLEKLRQFQELGHTAVLVIGDFTAQIGDPSGRDKTRPPLSAEDAKKNLKNYLKQAGKIIDVQKAEIVYNSEWLGKLDGKKLLELLSYVSLQQLTEREDFKKRLKENHSIQMHELLYPIMQGYDSVCIKADVELGGTEQLFNVLMGRELMDKMGMKPQNVMTMSLLVGTDGERKMSKSLGNYIGLDDEPGDMFGKVMSIPDALILDYAKQLLHSTTPEFEKSVIEEPKLSKEFLAFEIIKRYHNEIAAKKAKEQFDKVFSRNEIPDDAPELAIESKPISVLDLVMTAGVMKSKSDARRVIEQGGFEFKGEVYRDFKAILNPDGGETIRIGKRHFFRISR
jgi:tyrosyl-tRNA synthetase